MKELAHINKYVYKYKFHLLLGVLFTVISNIFQILPAQFVRYALDLVVDNLKVYRIFEGAEVQALYNDVIKNSVVIYGLIILGMALLRGFFLFLVRQTLIVMSRHIEYDLKNEVYDHYQTLPLSFYRRNNTGDLMARISEDVGRVRMFIGPAIMYGLNLFTLFIMLIPIMLSINVRLTLYALIPLPFLSFSIYFVNNLINKRSEEIQRSLSGLSTFVQEAFSGIRVIKSFARESESLEKFAEASDEYKIKSLRLTRVNSLFFPLILFLIGLSTIITIFVGGAEVIRGTLSFGNIAEFIIYINMLTWPVTSLGWITSIIQRAAASQKRINEFLLEKNTILSKENVREEISGEIVFENVSFVYPDTGIQALKDVSFTVKPGETLAVIGSTGSGKSTIANLLCRLFDVSSGNIHIDQYDIRAYDVQHLRSQIGYVPQDVFLFSDTINRNIAFGSIDVEENRIIQAAIDADLYHNIQDLPKGFGTILGERGITLSGGQKQRLSIARALVRDPKILILDDSLSAVDTKTENNILNNMKRIMMARTSIIISHRVSSAKLADHIIVLDDGEIVEMGNHESLMAENGVYKELYEKQLKAEELAGE
ncbi:MAG: ABC transporter ATP-binding protein [Cyclobacteriaceae bacterium]|nr:ABC transporter ATP-binding protein [Cyclobacteriaceae bacterium]